MNNGEEGTKEKKTDGGLVYAFKDLDLVTTERIARYMVECFENGVKIEQIAAEINRDPDEVFLFLFDQARKGNVKRSFAYRFI